MEAKTVKGVLESLTENERKVLVEIINEARKRVGQRNFRELPAEIRRSLELHVK